MDKFMAQELNRIARVDCNSFFYVDDSSEVMLREGWAKAFVEAERPIPESWREDFYAELFTDNEEYRKKLEESVRWFGVRWAKS